MSTARPPPLPITSSGSSSRVTSYASSGSNEHLLRGRDSYSSFARERLPADLDALLGSEDGFTISPEESQGLQSGAVPSNRVMRQGQSLESPSRSQARLPTRGQPFRTTSPRPTTPTALGSRSATPTIQSPGQKAKGLPLRLNTSLAALAPPDAKSSPTKAISPSLKHWQQLRTHVMAAPSPMEDTRSNRSSFHSVQSGRSKRSNLNFVSKAAGRLGFRQVAESAMASTHHRRRSSVGFMGSIGDLDPQQQYEVVKARQAFAREIKSCLDACAAEESRRRLVRASGRSVASSRVEPRRGDSKPSGGSSVHGASTHGIAITFDPDFSAFAPLLTELHRHLPAVRAKKIWCRTCPHHAALLAELGTPFLSDNATMPGERQQALEVFIAIVKNWAPDSMEEELDRWRWLMRVMGIDDRQIRKRSMALLLSFLHHDPSLPGGINPVSGAGAFVELAGALLRLLHDIHGSATIDAAMLETVEGLLGDLMEGEVVEVEKESVAELLRVAEVQGSLGGVERELMWLAVSRELGRDTSGASWLLDRDAAQIKVRRLALVGYTD